MCGFLLRNWSLHFLRLIFRFAGYSFPDLLGDGVSLIRPRLTEANRQRAIRSLG
eukprot:COSAG02_NODE_4544_length_5228_cov_8.569117_1_plen_53_part_10